MPAPPWEDLNVFLNTDEFGLPAVVKFRDEEAEDRAIVGIFDDPYLNAELGDAHDLDTNRPRLTCREDAVQGIGRGDRIEVAGRSFRVATGPQADGTGLAVLMLDEE